MGPIRPANHAYLAEAAGDRPQWNNNRKQSLSAKPPCGHPRTWAGFCIEQNLS